MNEYLTENMQKTEWRMEQCKRRLEERSKAMFWLCAIDSNIISTCTLNTRDSCWKDLSLLGKKVI